DECLWVPEKTAKNDSTAIHFSLVKEDGVAWNAGIRNGDYLLKINGHNIKNTQQAQAILNLMNYGEYADYVVKKKDGTVLKTKVFVKKLIQFQLLALGILGLIWMSIGFIVLMAKKGPIQKTFYVTGVASVLSIAYLLIPQNIGPGMIVQRVLSIIFAIGWTFGMSFFPFLIVYFFWIFPRTFKFIEHKWVKRVFWGIPALLLTMMEFSIFLFVPKMKNANMFFNILIRDINLLLAAASIVGWISLIVNYRRLTTKEEKKPIFIILVAYTLALVALFYTIQIAPAITDSVFNSPEFYTPVILIILLPISFAYSIFKYQLMDVSIVVKNTIIYGAATLTLAAIYFFLIYVVGQGISKAIGTEYQSIIAGIFFISFALVFQSTKDRFQDFITAKFYPEQFAYQKVILRYSNDVASMVGLENILDRSKETLVESLMIDHFGIMIREQDKKSFTLVRSVGIENKRLALMNNELQKFVTFKLNIDSDIVIEADQFAKLFPASEELLISENIFTIIPMIIKSEVVGLMLFGLKHSGAQFAGKDLELLSAAANQAAVSIENARLYEMEAQKLKIERDLELAKKIQIGLLPRCIPDTNGLDICGEMFSAMQVGGDYFDLIPVSDKKLFVVVGDVSGKGLSASLYMAKLQTMMQLYCVDNRSPKEILVQVNKKLYQEMEKNWFVTLSLAMFDMEKRTVKFCRAGHVPVLVSEKGKIDFYKTTGLGVGLERGVIFEKTLIEEELPLKKNQVYTFFSDGITEGMNENEELFGEERLAEVLKNNSDAASSQIMNSVWDALKTYCGKTEQYDDQTMVIVKVK
ncbi:MAG: SpoIIE family protein phosphatase, partial [Ignavibacteriaceae bacterium]